MIILLERDCVRLSRYSVRISFQSSSSNSWSSDESAGHLTVPLRSLAVGKEVTFHVPTTNVSGLNWMGSASENKDGEPRPPGIPTYLSGLRIF